MYKKAHDEFWSCVEKATAWDLHGSFLKVQGVISEQSHLSCN